jgi:hypothetical protein
MSAATVTLIATLVSLGATIVTLMGIAVTYSVSLKTLKNQREQLSDQRNQAIAQLKLMRSGQITDRFTKAIEHLGGSSPEVRIGGIFALEQIANESADYVPHIVTTLAAFVRYRLPAPAAKKYERVDVLNARAPDAGAALAALCRPPLSNDRPKSWEFGGLDLTRTDLRRSSLRGANLSHASLFASRLDGADLRHANLSYTNIGSVDFGKLARDDPEFEYGADLRHADLTGHRKNEETKLREARQDPKGPTEVEYAVCPDCNPSILLPPGAVIVPDRRVGL